MKDKASTSTTLAVVLTVFAVLLSWYIIAPGYRIARNEKTELEDEIVVLQEKLNWLENAEAALSSGEATFNKMLVSVPTDGRDEPNAIAELEAIGLKHNLTIPTISFADVSVVGGEFDEAEVSIPGSKVSISLVIDGSFDDVSGFIASVENSVKFMNIRSLTFAIGETTESSLSLEIEAYAQGLLEEEF